MSFGPLAPSSALSGGLRSLCTVQTMTTTATPMGSDYPSVASSVENVPCDLQPMATSRAMLYKAASAATLFDLFLPDRREGQLLPLAVGVGTRFVVGGVVYNALGDGMMQGNTGRQRVPVQRVNP